MRGIGFALVFAAWGPVGAAAGTLAIKDGIYDAYDCTVPVSDQRIEVKGRHLAFYETTCETSNPQTLRGLDNTILVDAACQGEGETWTARFILMQTADGGLAMMNEVWGDHYARCN